MGTMKPQPALLTIWRMILSCAMCVPAFVNALFNSGFGRVWMILTAVWVILFLAGYLVYLPLCYRNLSYQVSQDRVEVYRGVLYRQSIRIPLRSIQFVAVSASPPYRLFGLCSLAITAPGGRTVLPGLLLADARRLADTLQD